MPKIGDSGRFGSLPVKVRRQRRLHSHLGRAKPAENTRFESYRRLVSMSGIQRIGGANFLKIGLKRRRYGLFRWSQGRYVRNNGNVSEQLSIVDTDDHLEYIMPSEH